jgi:agmatine/peptidylarginine deiminase
MLVATHVMRTIPEWSRDVGSNFRVLEENRAEAVVSSFRSWMGFC